MRIVLVGTEMAPVRPRVGALETLLCGWATGLATDHAVTVLSVPGPPVDSGAAYRTVTWRRPEELAALLGRIGPDVVVVNNRPDWQAWVEAPTLHLLHNWPDAWELPGGRSAKDAIGAAGVAAVSRSLAGAVAGKTGRDVADVAVVRPFVAPELLAVAPRPVRGLVVSPNRLMVKKGVRELAAAADHPAMRAYRVLITDYLSPWSAPTTEHRMLRAVVEASRAELIPPPRDLAAMTALYARADVVVCPSIRPEGLGLTAVEAQAAAVPVVSSGLGGLAEATLLPHLVADPHDPVDMARAVAAATALDVDARMTLRTRVAATWSPATSLQSLVLALRRARPALPLPSVSRH